MWLWSLGRLGSRIALYGPPHSVVAGETVGEWLKILLDLSMFTVVTASVIALIARRTNDRSRSPTKTFLWSRGGRSCSSSAYQFTW
jgi:hypothetical protein